MKSKLLLALSALIVSHIGTANADIQPVPKFDKGDVVVFVGDSITHGGTYHKDIFLFHATRYPNKPFKYYNAGISGDTAAGTIKRFENDIAIHKPNKSTIMLGMNDVGGHLYQTNTSTEIDRKNWLKQQSVIREAYLSNMQTLTDSLKKINSQIVYLTPSIYDQTVNVETGNNWGRNDELAVYAKAITQMAAQNDVSVVDFQAPMLQINHKWQKLDPTRTIVSSDRVHPKEKGHFLMAYSFLKAQGEQGKVADLMFDVKKQSISKMHNCQKSGQVQMTSTSLSFSCKPLALPFPLNSEQVSMLPEIPFVQEMNQLNFKVVGLNDGKYNLSISNKLVGEFDETQLSNGIDLSSNTLTPMYQQSLRVK